MIRTKPLLRHKPLLPGTKRMKQRHRACGNPTAAQQAHQDLQRAHGCALCRLLGISFRGMPDGISPCGGTTIHHRTVGDKHGQLQIGQDATVALGTYHHQGYLLTGWDAEAMRRTFGPSLALHKRAFVELLQDLLGERSTAALQRWQDAHLADAA